MTVQSFVQKYYRDGPADPIYHLILITSRGKSHEYILNAVEWEKLRITIRMAEEE